MLYITCIFIFSYVLGLLQETHGLLYRESNVNRSTNIRNRRSIGERGVLNNNNGSIDEKNENKKSFILLKNKENIKSDLSEIRLLSQNKSAKQSATQTSNGTEYVANRALDGNLQTCALQNENQMYPWWMIDLSKNYKVDRVEIYNPLFSYFENGPKVNIFVTGEEYNDVRQIPVKYRCGEEIHSEPKADVVLNVKCNNNIGRYVYVFINSNDALLGLCEVKVYGDDFHPSDTEGNALYELYGDKPKNSSYTIPFFSHLFLLSIYSILFFFVSF